jgi:hypothetical protein
VDALHENIDAQHFETVPFDFNDRGVVADADEQPGRLRHQPLLDAGDELSFCAVGDGGSGLRACDGLAT